MEESKEERIRMVKALLQTSANEKGEVVTDFGTFKTFQEIGKKLQEIMGRPVWSHELAFVDMLIEEIKSEKKFEAMTKSVNEIAKEKPTLILVEK